MSLVKCSGLYLDVTPNPHELTGETFEVCLDYAGILVDLLLEVGVYLEKNTSLGAQPGGMDSSYHLLL